MKIFSNVLKNIHTLSENNMMIQPKPKRVSVALVLWMFWKTFVMVSTNPDDVNFKPSRLLICDVAIITDVAEVNPTVTGIDIKSISTPRKKTRLRTGSKIKLKIRLLKNFTFYVAEVNI